MKVGSIVELINNKWSGNFPPSVKYPKLKGVYVVREIQPSTTNDNTCAITLEEIINPVHPNGYEYAFKVTRFRELLPPMEIQDALDSCQPVLIELNK